MFFRKAILKPWPLLLIVPILYALTLARTPVLGDPTEYTYVAHELGIAHPPGYAFITLVGKLFQTLVPIGSVALRMHLLAAVSGMAAGLAVYGSVRSLLRGDGSDRLWAALAAVFSALTVTTAADHWQHSIHANPHIMTAAFLSVNLYLLIKWAQTGKTRPWLLLFSLSAGLGATHHPLTIFSFPAYALFILLVRPRIWREGRTLLQMGAMALLGLSLFLYFPIRSPMLSDFWPNTMNTADGFLAHVLARGLSDSLPYYSLAEQPLRLVVFWSILRLQFAWPTLILSGLGLWHLLRGSRLQQKAGILLTAAFLTNYAFVISLKAQDIMAYILGPLLIVGLLAGVGFYALIEIARRGFEKELMWIPAFAGMTDYGMGGAALLLLLIGPGLQIGRNLPRISLADYDEGAAHIAAVFDTFEGEGEAAVLLNNWEFMTPLWYAQFVENRWPEPQDVQPEFVSAAVPWLPSVFNYLPGGPVYLNSYRREIVDAGFRLRPHGPFYQVAEPGNTALPAELTAVTAVGDGIEIVGYELPQQQVKAGDFVPLTVAMRVPQQTVDFYAVVLQVGDLAFPFTTDTHLITPLWEPGEIIVERFDFALPHDLQAGDYPLTLGVNNLSLNRDSGIAVSLPPLQVAAQASPPETEHLLANFRQRVGLRSAVAYQGLRRVEAPWEEPLTVQIGEVINLFLEWEAIDFAEESYTIFVHLNDLANRPVVDDLDYTPLGGAVPTHLWIPKWLPGQRMTDPYRLEIPPNLPAGTYYIEVGLYEMTSGRRLHRHDAQGNLIADRYILGSVEVGP